MEYDTFDDAAFSLPRFIEDVYNGPSAKNRSSVMKRILGMFVCAAMLGLASPGNAQTLASVKARGILNCGANPGLGGFAVTSSRRIGPVSTASACVSPNRTTTTCFRKSFRRSRSGRRYATATTSGSTSSNGCTTPCSMPRTPALPRKTSTRRSYPRTGHQEAGRHRGQLRRTARTHQGLVGAHRQARR